MAIVLFILAWTLAPPAQRYFAQRAQINSVRAQVASNNQALVEAALDLEKWKDPEFIKTQARERLHDVQHRPRANTLCRIGEFWRDPGGAAG